MPTPRQSRCAFTPGRCYHFACRMAALRATGRPNVATKLERNAEARDWLSTWGLMLYDPQMHGRDSHRRTLAARIIRAMRSGQADYADATRTGCWTGALL